MPSPPTGFTAFTAAQIKDAANNPLAAGTLVLTPTDDNNVPIPVIAGGAGGELLEARLPIVNGSIGSSVVVADTALTSPPNISYRATILDPNGRKLQVVKGIQFAAAPTATPAFSFDTYVPQPPIAPTYTQGTPGLSAYQLAVLNGYSGSLTAWLASLVGPAGLSGPVASITLIDTATGAFHVITITNGQLGVS